MHFHFGVVSTRKQKNYLKSIFSKFINFTGNKRYVVEVKAFEKAKVMMGEQNEARIVEEFCEFRVNGMKGWGGAEWEYRNMSKKN